MRSWAAVPIMALLWCASAQAASPQARCLTITAYHEARSDGPVAMRAVEWVVYNRARMAQTSPCAEVHRPGAFTSMAFRRHDDLPNPTSPEDQAMLKAAAQSADQITQGSDSDPTHGALFFQRLDHHRHLPLWAGRATAWIGSHVFSIGSFHTGHDR